MDILSNWELNPEDIVATTTDNGSNVIAAFKNLKILRISCFGHNLDLAVKKSLDNSKIQEVLTKCRLIVQLFHRSWKKTRDLREKQDLFNLPQHKLKGDVTTRWGSTYDMVCRIIEQQQAINAILLEDRKNWSKMLTDAQFTTLETIAEVLQNVSVLTDALAGEKEVTASTLPFVLRHIKSNLTPGTDSRLAEQMKKALLENLESRYSLPAISDTLKSVLFLIQDSNKGT